MTRVACFGWVVVGAVVMAAATRAEAARLQQLELVPDGSVEPPGDLLVAEICFHPEDREITLEVRAYLVSGEHNRQVTPVKARGQQHRDADGNLLVLCGVRRPAESAMIRQEVVVAYQDLDVSPGRHLLGYEVRGMAGDRVAFVRATELTTLRVSDQTRTDMVTRVERTASSVRSVKAPVLVVENGKAEIKEIEKPLVDRTRAWDTRTVAVEIRGEFARGRLKSAVAPVAETDPVRRYTEELKHRPWEPLKHRQILYFTNRNVVSQERSADRFGNEVSPTVTHGSVMVNIPVETHERGQLETPGWWEVRDPEEHFLIETLNTLSALRFRSMVASPLAEDGKDVLLLVHGFNNTFEFTTLRLAQLVHDIRFRGTPVVFSWPSEGSSSIAAYHRDAQRAAASVTPLADELDSWIQATRAQGASPGKIHVIAHSMGNQVLLNATSRLGAAIPAGERPFGHVVLAAPDMNADDFNDRLATLLRSADSVTMYFCGEDKALKVAHAIHGKWRVGEGIACIRALENVDADRANTSFLGHDYYVSNSLLLIDLELLIDRGFPPAQRPTIRRTQWMGYAYWMFP